ncbi:DedD protein [Pseudomonas aeruginosa VRFPA02]|nr:DedD protein [Pseudomonas aeruginosa VRFPA02]
MLERGLKQRIVGALVLIALAVIFLPMLFTREDESRQVVVEAPPRPQSPAMPSVEVQPTEVPELQPGEEGNAPEIVEEGSPAAAGQPRCAAEPAARGEAPGRQQPAAELVGTACQPVQPGARRGIAEDPALPGLQRLHPQLRRDEPGLRRAGDPARRGGSPARPVEQAAEAQRLRRALPAGTRLTATRGLPSRARSAKMQRLFCLWAA